MPAGDGQLRPRTPETGVEDLKRGIVTVTRMFGGMVIEGSCDSLCRILPFLEPRLAAGRDRGQGLWRRLAFGRGVDELADPRQQRIVRGDFEGVHALRRSPAVVIGPVIQQRCDLVIVSHGLCETACLDNPGAFPFAFPNFGSLPLVDGDGGPLPPRLIALDRVKGPAIRHVTQAPPFFRHGVNVAHHPVEPGHSRLARPYFSIVAGY